MYLACNHSLYTVCTQWLHPLLASPRILSVHFFLLMVHDYTQCTYYRHFHSYGHPLVPCCPDKRGLLYCYGLPSLVYHLLPSGSPNITSLVYESRTLTCTSTGGPATTVTWRRDGAVITLNTTHQQNKIVVDPVEGTYQTVLTIDPSVSQSDIPGLFCCTVENARGRSSMTVVVSGNGELI